jgi:UDP-N-acetylglucosamine 2-epimerase (non-hydrolysing)
MRNVTVTIGTRPEAIKLMPVLRAFHRAGVRPEVIVTGQHDELLRPIFSELEIHPSENLEVMSADQSLAELSARVLGGMQRVLRRNRTEILVVQGDTTSAAMSALAGFYEGVEVAHVEAGLRTGSRRNPFPEEVNRRLVACLADVHFAPTATARDNLLREGIHPNSVHLVGNTVVDALRFCRDHLLNALPPDSDILRMLAERKEIVVVTAHRRESFGHDLAAICEGVRRLAEEFRNRLEIIVPVHPNPSVRGPVHAALSGIPDVRLVLPLSYLSFLRLLTCSKLVITDSGGVQEEAATLGIPVLVTRRTCERLEAVEAGVSELVGPDAERIHGAARRLLLDANAYKARAVGTDAFGDGKAAERIVRILLQTTP